MGAKKPFGGVFLLKFPIKKTGISCSGGNQFQVYKKFGLSLKEIFRDASSLFHTFWTLSSIGQEVEQHKKVANIFYQMDQYRQHMHVVMLLKTNEN
jgi:peroxiredoxin family protein